jgi:DNA (cytosine-5)-methyltransferase 1
MAEATRTVVEICAGAGGQSLGLERAGFRHTLAVELDADAASTLRANRPQWHVLEGDVRGVRGPEVPRTDLFAGGVPCPPFSVAGKQLGESDERDLFPEALRIVEETGPRAVMLENVRGLADPRFRNYRESVLARLKRLGYASEWRLVYASDFGLAQLRPRFILVALQPDVARHFRWPSPEHSGVTVGGVLEDLMGQRGWTGTARWVRGASHIAPTIVGGSKKHGGADLGPSRARAAWARLGVNGSSVAEAAPGPDDSPDLTPRLTNRMVARLQGFPDDWAFSGRKTSVYRQIGNAFPPPVAHAIGSSIGAALADADVAADVDARGRLEAWEPELATA